MSESALLDAPPETCERILELPPEAPPPQSASWAGTKWETCMAITPPERAAIAQACTQLGAQGWELTAIADDPELNVVLDGQGQLQRVPAKTKMLMFKRPVREGVTPRVTP